MKCQHVAIVFGLVFCARVTSAQIDLKVEPNHSTVGFSVPIAGLTKVTGKFTAFSVAITYDEKDFTRSAVLCSIKVSSIDTGIDDRDKDLQGEEFFKAVEHPYIVFKSKRIEKNDASFAAIGDLTMLGVIREIALPFFISESKMDDGRKILGISAQTKINRLDFGVGTNWKHTLIPNFIGHEVTIEIDMWTRPPKKSD